ncbi:dihydrofolate reductase family protein [Trichococcus alkaliphilus]|uniref:dihydrofolate reductase family protein n=1 Tax=Trichococcus alkaliphilus TaxID=2052943 RepID=UPI000D0BCE53|nr:dihydrofolate reductase family protein [Trichococcus alkaliphilus]
MNRPYRVICHMAMSIDGRAAGHYLGAPEFGPYGKAYEDTLAAYGSDNWICGRITFEQHITFGNKVDLSAYPDEAIPREDYIHPTTFSSYAIAVDPQGRLGWQTNTIGDEYPERRGDHIVTILSEAVSDRYLAHLRKIGVSYIFAGKSKPLSMTVSLDKLHKHFGIQTFMLVGGGFVNGSFASEGLVDEISLIIAPLVEGVSDSVSLFEFGSSPDQRIRKFKLDKFERIDPDGIRLTYLSE